jgi:phosphate transport system permease protein
MLQEINMPGKSSVRAATPDPADAPPQRRSMILAGAQARQRRRRIQKAVFGVFRLSVAINGLALAVIVYFIAVNGLKAINWTFLSQPPMDSMTKGGILPCIVGTLALSVGALVVAFPIGVASAVYLNE